MEGRGAGTKGIDRAAHYIEQQFKALGLEPAGNHSFEQPFTVTTGAKLKGKNDLIVRIGSVEKKLKLGEDYVPLSFSSVGSVSGPVVFAGYGATADEFGYDDYAHLDVKDKIVVVLRYEPDKFGEKSGHQGLTQHSHLITKAINARNHGAKAVILVNGKLGAERGRPAAEVWQPGGAARCRHSHGAGEERGGRELVQGSRQVAGRRAEGD